MTDRTPDLAGHARATARPLCVDLDGTLIATDALWEGVAWLATHRPLALLAALLRLLHGKAAFKAAVAAAAPIDPEALPLRAEVVAWVAEERRRGRRVVLATAADRAVAEAVAAQIGLFDEVVASDGRRNLGSAAKRAALVDRFGERGFDYAGDHPRKDLPVFEAAEGCILVGPAAHLRPRLAAQGRRIERTFPVESLGVGGVLRALRVRQWVKNLLVLVPLLTAHLLVDPAAWGRALLAFLAFCLLASGTYLVNDLHDLRSDRLHPSKRRRPLAAGLLPIPIAVAIAGGLVAVGVAIGGLLLPAAFLASLLGYLGLTLAYSFLLKSRLLVDVIGLALLYTIRIVAGAAAIAVVLSPWLLMFSLFIFTSLAFLKRFVELRRVPVAAGATLAGRGYAPTDLAVLRVLGPGCGLLSVLVLALYVHSPQVEALYAAPQALWLLVPIMVYWVSRIWFLAERGEVDDDPVEFAVRDRATQVVVAAMALVAIAALRLPAFGEPGAIEPSAGVRMPGEQGDPADDQ
jgi:4-hydroxybenzoate polyprenyltransferase/phosphoserine phosphatase